MRRATAAVLLCVGATAVGIGWLYLLRNAGLLAIGPRVPEALPLQRLAGSAGQPLGRVLAAWVTTGVALGVLLSATGLPARWPRAAFALASSAVTLMALGAAADAITASEPILRHLLPQPQRGATWLAAGLLAAGAAAVPGIRPPLRARP